MNNLASMNKKRKLEENMKHFNATLQIGDQPVQPELVPYLQGYLDVYNYEAEYEIEEKSTVHVVNLNKREIKQMKSEKKGGILWSGGLDSTTLKEKLTDAREFLGITQLYCFFFPNANPKYGSDREVVALEKLKLKEHYDPEDKNSFIRIIEMKCDLPDKKMNLITEKDKCSPANHNQWMLMEAIHESMRQSLNISTFYFDVDCAKNHCYCDKEQAFSYCKPYVERMSSNSIKLERYYCFEDCDSFLKEKRMKIDYLKEKELWELISFCYATTKK